MSKSMHRKKTCKRVIYRLRVKKSSCRKRLIANCAKTKSCRLVTGTKRKYCRKNKNTRV